MQPPIKNFTVRSSHIFSFMFYLIAFFALIIAINIAATFFQPSSNSYHDGGALFGALIVLIVGAVMIQWAVFFHRKIIFKNGVLTFTKAGWLIKYPAEHLSVSAITSISGSVSNMNPVGKAPTAKVYQLEMVDSLNNKMVLSLDGFWNRSRQKVLQAIEPALTNPQITKVGQVQRVVSIWSRRNPIKVS